MLDITGYLILCFNLCLNRTGCPNKTENDRRHSEVVFELIKDKVCMKI